MNANTRNNRAAERYAEEIRRCPKGGNGVHSWMMTAANFAAIAGIPPMEAEAEIIRAMTRPPSPSSEVSAAIRKAYSEYAPGADYTPRRYSAPKPKPLPQTALKFIQRGDGAEESRWREASPFRVELEPGPKDAITIMRTLFRPSEYVFCGERYGGGGSVRMAGEWIARFEDRFPVPPHFIPNPLTGDEHPTSDGKQSRRGDSAVAAFRYAVAEFDSLSKPEQLAFWWGFKSAPIVALIDSGGKSIHALLRVDCATRADWERDIEERLFPRVLCPLGCDPACRNESRLSRLPGHFRREKNAWQRLLFLSPEGTRR